MIGFMNAKKDLRIRSKVISEGANRAEHGDAARGRLYG